MFSTPGIEVCASAIVDGQAAITHTVSADGCVEIQMGGHVGILLCLSEDAVRALNHTTGEAIGEIEQLAA